MSEEEIKQYFGDMPPFTKQDCEGCYEYKKLKYYEFGWAKRVDNLEKTNRKLKKNWNKLEQWCKELGLHTVVDKMQEIKGSDESEE